MIIRKIGPILIKIIEGSWDENIWGEIDEIGVDIKKINIHRAEKGNKSFNIRFNCWLGDKAEKYANITSMPPI